jgi:hypothetical protein
VLDREQISTHIKAFPDGTILEFDKGKFDDWCVYLIERGRRAPPRDTEYFAKLKELAATHGATTIYADFVAIYDLTRSCLEESVLATITALAARYGHDSLDIDKLFSILYAGMIAEENKQNARLKKRIKRLGMHQVLIDGLRPDAAASFSKGKPWRVLDIECQRRGF